MKPYYEHAGITIYHGDCREILPQLPRKDGVIIADPPYGETALVWDRWPEGWLTAAATYGRSLWCFGSMRMFFEHLDEFATWRFAQDVVWEKNNGSGPTMPDRFKRVHEHITHWYRGNWDEIFHVTPRFKNLGDFRGRLRTSLNVDHRGVYKPRSWADDGTRLAQSVIWERSMHQRAVHPTQKPEGIASIVIKYSTPEIGGFVLDPFFGSGSVLIAAKRLHRSAIGIEIEEKYCEIAAKRLSQEVFQFTKEPL